MYFNLLMSALLFVLGAAVGSFLNVLIYRTFRGENWVWGRSKCDHCQRRIFWFDNLPIISYFWLRGKTRCCRRPISQSYPIVEFMTGLLFVWWYLGGSLFFQLTTNPSQTIQPLFWLVVGVLLLFIFFTDWLYLIIPDIAVISLTILTVGYRLFLTTSQIMKLDDLLYALLGMLIAVIVLGSIWLITSGRGMGLGDVKFAVPMALLLGWPKVVVGLFVAFLLGGVVASGLLLTRKKKIGETVPFGPFLVASTVLSLVWGEALISWYVGLL